MIKYLVLLSLAGWGSLFVTSATLAWQANVNGLASDDDKALAVTVDGTGNVVAAGSTRNAGDHSDFTVVRLAGTNGREMWRRVIKGPVDANGAATAVAMDPDANVVAAGSTGADFTVVKLSGASGAELWRRVVSGPAGAWQAAAVAAHAAGNVIAAGYVVNNDGAPDLTVVKLDGASGVERWRRVITGSGGLGREEIAGRLLFFALMSPVPPLGLKVDASLNVVVAGVTLHRGATPAFTVVKLNGASGDELWRRDIHGTADEGGFANALAVDAAENVLAAGVTENTGTSADFTVVKLSGVNGAELWRRVINGTGNGGDSADSIAVDAAGNVFAAGCIDCRTDPRSHLTVVKLDGANGVERWRRIVRGTAESPRLPFTTALAVDPLGDAVAVGSIVNIGTGQDFTLVKLNGAGGAVRWRRVINGTAKGSDAALAVVVDASGSVIAAGVTDNRRTRLDFTVVKLRAADGEDSR
jgi:hypothetical protein